MSLADELRALCAVAMCDEATDVLGPKLERGLRTAVGDRIRVLTARLTGYAPPAPADEAPGPYVVRVVSEDGEAAEIGGGVTLTDAMHRAAGELEGEEVAEVAILASNGRAVFRCVVGRGAVPCEGRG